MAVLRFSVFPELPAKTEYRYEKVESPNLPNGPKTGVQSKGMLIDDVAAGLRSGRYSPNQLPLKVVNRNGITYSMNTRSLMALKKAGMNPTIIENVTGDVFFKGQLTSRLSEMGGSVSVDFVPPIRPERP
jgi:hypothetical protein